MKANKFGLFQRDMLESKGLLKYWGMYNSIPRRDICKDPSILEKALDLVRLGKINFEGKDYTWVIYREYYKGSKDEGGCDNYVLVLEELSYMNRQ